MATTDIPGAKLGLYKAFAVEQNPNLYTGYTERKEARSYETMTQVKMMWSQATRMPQRK